MSGEPLGLTPRMRAHVRRLTGSSVLKQTGAYTAASTLASLASGAATAYLAAILTVPAFGVFAFGRSLLQYGSIFFEFGLFAPAGRMAALAEGQERREVLGAALMAYAPVGAAFSVAILAVSFFVDERSGYVSGQVIYVAGGPKA